MAKRRKNLVSLTGQGPPRHPLEHVPLSPEARQAMRAGTHSSAPPDVSSTLRSLVMALAPLPVTTQARIMEGIRHAEPARFGTVLEKLFRLARDNRAYWTELAMLAAACHARMDLLEELATDTHTHASLRNRDLQIHRTFATHLSKLAAEPALDRVVHEILALALRPLVEDAAPLIEGTRPFSVALLAGLAFHYPAEFVRVWSEAIRPAPHFDPKVGQMVPDPNEPGALPSPSRSFVELQLSRNAAKPEVLLESLTGLPYERRAGAGSDAAYVSAVGQLLERVHGAELTGLLFLKQGVGENWRLFAGWHDGAVQTFGWDGDGRAETSMALTQFATPSMELLAPRTLFEHQAEGKTLPSLEKKPDPSLKWFLT